MTMMHEKGSTMDYQEAVTAAAGALQRGEAADWELAQLTFEHTLSRGEYQTTETKRPMAVWCEDIKRTARRRFSVTTGRAFRAAWVHFISLETSDMPEFTEVLRKIDPEHYDSATVQARVDGIALEKLLTAGTPEAKREVFERLRVDPDVSAPTLSVVPEPAATPHGDLPPRVPNTAEPITSAKGALRLAVFVLDARVAAQHYAEALSGADLDRAGREVEAKAIDTVLRAWQRLRFIVDAPGGLRLVREVEDFLADVRA
jgi:hypothetical protein